MQKLFLHKDGTPWFVDTLGYRQGSRPVAEDAHGASEKAAGTAQ